MRLRAELRRGMACALLLAAIACPAPDAIGQQPAQAPQPHGRVPARDAARERLEDLAFPRPDRDPRSYEAWHATVTRHGSRYIRLRFADIATPTDDADFEVIVARADYSPVKTYARKDFLKSTSFWTDEIPGGVARVLVARKGAAHPQGLKFRVSEILYQVPTAVLRSILDEKQSKLRLVANFPSDTPLQQTAKAVAKLRFVGRDGDSVCSAFLVGPDLLLTNEHCVPHEGACETLKGYFDWVPEESADYSRRPAFTCRKLEKVDAYLDYALFRFDDPDGLAKGRHALALDAREAVSKEMVYVVQYPGIDQAQQFARDGCQVGIVPAPGVQEKEMTDFGHSCDTIQGSSGSPVLDLEHRVIGLHHWGFDIYGADAWKRANRAVRMAEIRKAIEGLLQ